jgi:hypothetical protein
MNSMSERNKRTELVETYRAQIKQLTAEGNFFEQLLLNHRKRLLALGDDEQQETYLLQLVKTHQHQLAQKVLELDRKLAGERDLVAKLGIQLREGVIMPPPMIPRGAVVLVKGVYRDDGGVRLSLESVNPCTLTQYCTLQSELGSQVKVLHFESPGTTATHPFYVSVWVNADTAGSLNPGSLLYK